MKLGLGYRRYADRHGLLEDKEEELSNPEIVRNEANRYEMVK